MVTFVTLFLSLTIGSHPVRVGVGDAAVAAVRVELDGGGCGLAVGPRWEVDCDFGPALAPHELAAVALDAAGAEIEVARQWVNVPRPRAELAAVLHRDEGGAWLRLDWAALDSVAPAAVRVELDGAAVEVTDPHRIRLPPHDPGAFHVLSVDLQLSDGVTARRDLTFGGQYGDELSTELTAIPLLVPPGDRLPAAAALQGRVLKAGRPLEVRAVERVAGEIIVVTDPTAHPRLRRLGDLVRESGALRSQLRRTDEAITQAGHVTRFALPVAARSVNRAEAIDLLPVSPPRLGAFSRLVTHPDEARPGLEVRLADAVAVAGLTAAASNRPRAVVFELGPGGEDHSVHSPAAVRRYLELLGVPLHVWSAEPKAPERSPWGVPKRIARPAELRAAIDALAGELAHQTILWVDGRHLAHDVTLVAPEGSGWRLLGAPVPKP